MQSEAGEDVLVNGSHENTPPNYNALVAQVHMNPSQNGSLAQQSSIALHSEVAGTQSQASLTKGSSEGQNTSFLLESSTVSRL